MPKKYKTKRKITYKIWNLLENKWEKKTIRINITLPKQFLKSLLYLMAIHKVENGKIIEIDNWRTCDHYWLPVFLTADNLREKQFCPTCGLVRWADRDPSLNLKKGKYVQFKPIYKEE